MFGYGMPFQAKYVVWGKERCDVSHAAIDGVATGGTIVAAVTARRIVIVTLHGNLSVSGTVQLLSEATAITGAIGVGTTAGQINVDMNPTGAVKTAIGEALKVTITGGGNLRGFLAYITPET